MVYSFKFDTKSLGIWFLQLIYNTTHPILEELTKFMVCFTSTEAIKFCKHFEHFEGV